MMNTELTNFKIYLYWETGGKEEVSGWDVYVCEVVVWKRALTTTLIGESTDNNT